MSVTVTDTFGNAVCRAALWRFRRAGTFTSPTVANPFFLRTGSFTADGNGSLTFGIEDINPPGGTATTSFTGLYSSAQTAGV